VFCDPSAAYAVATPRQEAQGLSADCLIDFPWGCSPSAVTLVNLIGQSTVPSWYVLILIVFLVTVH
jgi:hypothetical protein